MSIENRESKKNLEYEIYLDAHAERDLERLSSEDADWVNQEIVKLGNEPRPYGVKKLWDDLYRIRVGHWRVIYLIDDQEKRVVISRVKRREKDTYRR